jgi:hypothetical protein
MKTCDERWRKELLDHATGAPASAKLALHLSGCVVCSAALLDGRERMAEIDLGLHRLASAEASSQAVARATAAVREPQRSARLFDWRWATALVATAAMLIAVSVYLRNAHERDRQALSAAASLYRWRSPTEMLLRSAPRLRSSTPPRLGEYFYHLDGVDPDSKSKNATSRAGFSTGSRAKIKNKER